MTKDEIQKRIEELEKSRAQLVQHFNLTLGEIRGQLTVYRQLLEEEE